MNKAINISTEVEVIGQTIQIHMDKIYNFSLDQKELFLVDNNLLYPVDLKIAKKIIYKVLDATNILDPSIVTILRQYASEKDITISRELFIKLISAHVPGSYIRREAEMLL